MLNIRSDIAEIAYPRMFESESAVATNESIGLLATIGNDRRKSEAKSPINNHPRRTKYIVRSLLITAKYALGGKSIARIFDPSSGGIGIRLNIAIPIFTE